MAGIEVAAVVVVVAEEVEVVEVDDLDLDLDLDLHFRVVEIGIEEVTAVIMLVRAERNKVPSLRK
jgi:hypothetical protein